MQPTDLGRWNLSICAFAGFVGLCVTPAEATTPTSTITPVATPTACPDCSRLGYLSVSQPTLDPPRPVVGDLVTFSFPINYALPDSVDCSAFGSASCTFGDTGSLLDGDELPARLGDAIVVHRRVEHAGATVVQLHVTARTEEQCYSSDPLLGCVVYFQFVSIEASSSPLNLEVAETNGTTPTPTPIPTPTNTAEPPHCSGDCNGDHAIMVDDLLTLVNIALGDANVSTCLTGDANHDNQITIDEILTALSNGLNGCGTA